MRSRVGVNFYLFGISHFDPLGRGRLIGALKRLHEVKKEPPIFVAVEYDSGHFERIKCQRPSFRQALGVKDPRLSVRDLDIYANSLVYEGDAHLEVFPDARTVWLDQGRIVHDESMIDGYADDRLAMYLRIAQNKLAGSSIERLSKHFLSQPDSDIDLERSKRFAKILRSEIDGKEDVWAAVVVGRGHTNSKTQGSMAEILAKAGEKFEVIDLCE